MDKIKAVAEAKRLARVTGDSYYAILCNDGCYIVATRKPMLGNVNGTRDVIEIAPDGQTFLA
jgi:hypothetical protein